MASTAEVSGEFDPDPSGRQAPPAPPTPPDSGGRGGAGPGGRAPWWQRLSGSLGGLARLLGRRPERGPGGPPIGAASAVGAADVDRSLIEEVLRRFQEHIGFSFSDATLLQQALTHRSWLGANGSDLNTSNERMEFLGDSVLELVVNEYLYGHYPDSQEGDLTQMKSKLVSRNILSGQASDMSLGSFLFLSPAERESGGRERDSILADAFEAVIGALYLDGGMAAASHFIEVRLLVAADELLKDHKFTNYKSRLQEHVQATFKTYPRYRVSAQSGPDHRKLFTVEVNVRGSRLGEGHGSNKKRAEQAAARDALHHLGALSPEDEASEDAVAHDDD